MVNAYTIWVPGRPATKERPRLGRGKRVYTPAKTSTAEQVIADAWLDAGGPTFDGSVRVLVDYTVDGQLITVERVDWKSALTGDIDNYVKLTLDGLQKAEAFKNDRQVVSLWCDKAPWREIQEAA